MTETLNNSDSDLIGCFLEQNDQHAFDLLVKRYQDMVYNFCYRFLGSYDDALDCSQEVFIKVFKNLRQFRNEASFSSWLYRIVMNSCKEMVRSKPYKVRLKEAEIDKMDFQAMKKNHFSSSPEKVLLRKEFSEAFQSALLRLKKTHRLMIIMRDIEGRSYDEIATITGMKSGTVRSSLARARIRMAS
ncbi:MAG: sigma-70 family RNA polymerase sigma factor, partial [Bacteroidetes bacterium]|nr:sigma-70 family RNA polymerase sigma factor [Bacteroidota bacterium]